MHANPWFILKRKIVPIALGVLVVLSGFGCSDDKPASEEQPIVEEKPSLWNETAVRKILQTFAYGGHSTDQQITLWAGMDPEQAITEILSFDAVNEKLSPSEDDTSAQGGRLEDLMAYWSLENTSTSNPSPFPLSQRVGYGTFYTYPDTHSTLPNQTVLYSAGLQNSWVGSINKRGLNPFRQKFGLFLTNYLMAVNLNKVRPPLIRRLYDDVLDMLANGASFDQVLARGAYSAAIAMQYGHNNNVYNNQSDTFRGNDDFAREFHQLFFRINGSGEDPDYHENTTIEHTAWLLTGMQIDRDPEVYQWASNRAFDHWVAPLIFTDHLDNNYQEIVTTDPITGYITYTPGASAPRTINNLSNHHQAPLEILHTQIAGTTAKEKLIALAEVDINTEESQNNLPIYIVSYFADDNLTPEKKAAVVALWRDTPDKNVLLFLQRYAISPLFLNPDTFKYRTAFNRDMTIFNLNTVDNNEAYEKIIDFRGIMIAQGANVFVPAHNVFGGQTSLNAANNPNIFRSAYNDAIDGYWRISKLEEYQRDAAGIIVKDANGQNIVTWRKDWAKIVPRNSHGVYRVDDVGEWLWNRFIGDGLKNYTALERAYVNAFLATGVDFPALVQPLVAEDQITLENLAHAPLSDYMSSHQSTLMALDSQDDVLRRNSNLYMGLAIDFIIATPFMYAIGG